MRSANEYGYAIGALAIFAAVLVPGSLLAFTWAESYAKKTGKLKRQG